MSTEKTIPVSFRCYFPDGEPTKHFQLLKLSEFPRWIECYMFTHPNCTAVSVKVWAHDFDED